MTQASFRSWMLPEGVVEALPEEAEKLNRLESIALSTFARWGYQPLRPPMMEYAETFLSNNGNDNLNEQTIQFKDQKSGKQLGFRADITPQVARIDGHYLKTNKVSRYAYAGEVVRSYRHGSVRNPTVVGAELLGSKSQQADIEIVSLLIEYLNEIQVKNFIIELGNVDIIVELLSALNVFENYYALFFDALSRKDKEKLSFLAQKSQLSPVLTEKILLLLGCYGDITVIREKLSQFSGYPAVVEEMQRLLHLYEAISQQYPDLNLHVDLSDVRGYGYHNGLIFAAYLPDVWQPIARGGRYDGFGNDFGEDKQQRASIGFSCHLNLLTSHVSLEKQISRIIFCDFSEWDNSLHASLRNYVSELRRQGDTVILGFDDGVLPVQKIAYKIYQKGSDWVVKPLGSGKD